MLVAGCRSNYGSGWFKVFTWFFLWETRPACRGSHMQLELLIEAFTLWEGCCLVFSKKKRGDGWVALVWVLIHSVLFSCHDFVLNTLVFFFSGNFLLQRAKKPLSFHLCFFHNDIEWSGEENVKPSRFCEYTQFTKVSDQSLEFCAFSQTLQMHWNGTCLCPVMMMQLQQVITSLHSIVPAVLN